MLRELEKSQVYGRDYVLNFDEFDQVELENIEI